MPAAKALPQFEAFGSYVDPFAAGQTMVSFWLQGWRTSLDAAAWWTERWLESLAVFAPPASAAPARPLGAVIDLAKAAAARTVAGASASAAAAAEILETTVQTTASVAEDAISLGEQAAVVAADRPDDLTRLVGIGPKLSVALAERGVTRFAQIAAWTEADLAEVDKALDLKGRAVRDAWIAQARRLAAEA